MIVLFSAKLRIPLIFFVLKVNIMLGQTLVCTVQCTVSQNLICFFNYTHFVQHRHGTVITGYDIFFKSKSFLLLNFP